MTATVLIMWPLIAVLICLKRPMQFGLIWATIPPYLFLPEATAVNLPGLPDLSKPNVIALGLLLGLMVAKKEPPIPPEHQDQSVRKFQNFLLGGIFIGGMLTVAANPETIRYGRTVLPGLGLWEGISLMSDLMFLLVPFVLARKYLVTEDAIKHLIFALAISALFYSVLMLYEMRFSPQLHRLVYGFHQHHFNQHVRDGYRPMMFLQHGLWVGFYIFTGVIAAASLWRAGQGPKWLLAAVWLFVILFFSRNLGAFAICILSLGLLFFLGRRLKTIAVAAAAITILIYPALRQSNAIPLDTVLEVVGSIDRERMWSLGFRLRNEDELLERAAQKPMFGWAGWGRQHIYSSDGQKLSVSEGRWTQTIGARGWVGYIFFFGLLTCPALVLILKGRRSNLPALSYTLAIITTGNLIYMLPNSTLTPVGLLVFGAFAGVVQTIHSTSKSQDAVVDHSFETPSQTQYSRFARKA